MGKNWEDGSHDGVLKSEGFGRLLGEWVTSGRRYRGTTGSREELLNLKGIFFFFLVD